MWKTRWLSVAAICLCLVVLLLHWAAGSLACTAENSGCSYSGDKDVVYSGTLADPQGKPVPSTEFSVSFSSTPRRVHGFKSDGQGRYCVLWAVETETPFARIDNGSATTVALNEHVDRLAHGQPPPDGCQSGDRGIPWKRARDLRSSAQFVGVTIALGITILVLLAAIALAALPIGPRFRLAAFTFTAASTFLALAVWV